MVWRFNLEPGQSKHGFTYLGSESGCACIRDPGDVDGLYKTIGHEYVFRIEDGYKTVIKRIDKTHVQIKKIKVQ